jgi:hypothetical protein
MAPNLGFFPNISHQIDLFLFRRGKEALLSISEITKQIETRRISLLILLSNRNHFDFLLGFSQTKWTL